MYKKVQILGLGPYYLPLLYDILIDNGITEEIEVFRNISTNDEAILPNLKFKYKLHQPGSSVEKNYPCILGISGAKNKVPVLEYFREKQGISEDEFLNVQDRSSIIASSVILKSGCVIEQNVSISSQTSIGFGVSVKRNASVGHHCQVGNLVDINPGAIISGRVIIGENCTIGAGAVIIDGVKIGKNTLVGAGSVVTKDLPSGVVAYGNPCKIIRMR